MPEEQTVTQEDVGADSQVTFPDDARAALFEQDAQERLSTLETTLERATQEPGEEQSDQDQATPEERSKEEQDTPQKPLGVDALLNQLEGPQAEAVRKIVATNTRLQQDAAKLERQLPDIVQDAVSKALGEQQQEQQQEVQSDPNSIVANMTPQQKEAFVTIASQLGFVKTGDLEQREQVKTRDQFLSDGRQTALTEYGDAFGFKDDQGRIVLADGVEDKLNQRFEPIQYNGTVNLHDLYTLAYQDTIKQVEYDRGLKDGLAQANGRKQKLRESVTETGTSHLPTAPSIRGEKGSKTDNRDQVFSRAALLARQGLQRLRK